MRLPTGDYLEGALLVAWTLGCALVVALVVLRDWCRGLRGSEAIVAGGLILSAVWTSSGLLPAALGLLSRGSVAVTAAGIVVATVAGSRRRSRPAPTMPRLAGAPAPSPTWSWGFAVAASGVVALGTVAYLILRSGTLPDGVDALAFQLPAVAAWIQEGTIWQATEFQSELANGAYPHTGNLTHLLPMLAWDGAWAARYVGVPFLALTGVGVYALARTVGAAASTSVLVAAAVLSMHAVAFPAIEYTLVDSQSLAWMFGGAVFLLRWSETHRRQDLVLAGVGLGLALGTKWYALPYVPACLGVCAAAMLLARHRPAWVMRSVVGVGSLVLLIGGVWLVRNWVVLGNPVQPTPVRAFGVTIFDAPPNRILRLGGFSVSDYLFDAGVWKTYLAPAFYNTLGLVAPAALALTVPGVAVAVRRARSGPGRAAAARAIAVAASAGLVALIYMKIPYTALGARGAPVQTAANTRYVVPAIAGFVVIAGFLAANAGRLRPVVEAVLLVATGWTAVRTFQGLGVPGAPSPGRGELIRAGLVIGALCLALATGIALRGTLWRRPALATGLVVVLLAGAASAGWLLHRRATSTPYAAYDAGIAWLDARAPHHARIGMAGAFTTFALEPALPAFGPRLQRRVSYVGHLDRGTMADYATAAAFQDAVRRGRFDYLLLGNGSGPRPPGPGQRLAWSRAAGFRQVTVSRSFTLMARDR